MAVANPRGSLRYCTYCSPNLWTFYGIPAHRFETGCVSLIVVSSRGVNRELVWCMSNLSNKKIIEESI